MINIPEAVAELLLCDTVWKNIRISFPFDDIADITNNELDSETVKFSESFCSRSELKFGLCEASTIEFDCYDIPNIKDKTIDVAIEVDVSAIVDELEEYETREDLDFPIYSIPYGRFIVASSIKDSSDMRKRQVEAYSEVAYHDWTINNPVTLAQYSMLYGSKSPIIKRLDGIVFAELPDLIDTLEREDVGTEAVQERPLNIKEGVLKYKGTDIGTLGVDVRLAIKSDCITMGTTSDDANIYSCENVHYAPAIKIMEKFLEDVRNNPDTEILVSDSSFMNYMASYIGSLLYIRTDGADNSILDSRWLQLTNKTGIYPGTGSSLGCHIDVELPYGEMILELAIRVIDQFGDIYWERHTLGSYSLGDEVPKIYRAELLGDKIGTPLLETQMVKVRKGVFTPEALPVSDIKDIVESYIELRGGFGKWTRYGHFEIGYLDENKALYPHKELYPHKGLYPKSNGADMKIYPHMISSCWYDDAMTKRYARVYANYKTGDEEEPEAVAEIWLIDPADYDLKKYQEYDLSNNYYIKNYEHSEGDMQNMLEVVANKIGKVRYMPFEADIVGTPQLEAGDSVAVYTKDRKFYSYILRRELNGILALIDSFTSN